jgi:predicted nucleotidyltransferase
MTAPLIIDPRVAEAAARHPHSLAFATVSGAHLYGFPSPDSDWDLRGVHLLPLASLLGLVVEDETVSVERKTPDFELDLVTHDLRKFVSLMLKRNGYVLEQLYSPIVVRTTPLHEELKSLGAGCVTRHHARHYMGFFETQWNLFVKENPRRVKPLLYAYRVLLTGIHLMRTGRIEANLIALNAERRLPWIDDLVALKVGSKEKATLADNDVAFHESECRRLLSELEARSVASHLPEEPSARAALNDLLVRARLHASNGHRTDDPA